MMLSDTASRMFGAAAIAVMFATGCGTGDSDTGGRAEEDTAVAQQALPTSYCRVYVDSNKGGASMVIKYGMDINDLHEFGFGDKISSIECTPGISMTMFIDKNWKGSFWSVSGTVWTLHTNEWGNLGDNASAVCWSPGSQCNPDNW